MTKHAALLMFVVACGATPDEFEAIELGQAEQAMAFKAGPNLAYGVTVEESHDQLQCINVGNDECSVPRTKSPTYFLDSTLTSTEKTAVRADFAAIDAATNWTFTETTSQATATIIVNRIDNFCTGTQIQDLVCINLTGQGNTLTEPTPIPNVYTEHTRGVMHIDIAAINASTTNASERLRRKTHGTRAAILSWMGLGVRSHNSSSPTRQAVLSNDTVGSLTNGEVCRVNAFLPLAEGGTAKTANLLTPACSGD
jgi:hypothetical protein